jgi:hypothetical protein
MYFSLAIINIYCILACKRDYMPNPSKGGRRFQTIKEVLRRSTAKWFPGRISMPWVIPKTRRNFSMVFSRDQQSSDSVNRRKIMGQDTGRRQGKQGCTPEGQDSPIFRKPISGLGKQGRHNGN